MTLELNRIYNMDCLQWMREVPENCIDAIVTDPPYGLVFMGKEWDHGIPGIPFWQEALRIVKPGAHMLAFGGTRTHHRLMVAIEDAGWEIRDCLGWIYGSGFPKSLDVSKQLDKMVGAERKVIKTTPSGGYKRQMVNNAEQGFRPADYYPEGNKFTSNEPITVAAKQWNGWGTALKPAWEPIVLCRKPLEGTVAENVQKWGTGAINIDVCRIGIESTSRNQHVNPVWSGQYKGGEIQSGSLSGRFPANLIHDGSDEVVGLFPETHSTAAQPRRKESPGGIYGGCGGKEGEITTAFNDVGGSAARFFYTAKADSTERNKYLKGRPAQKVNDGRDTPIDNAFQRGETLRKNIHPTVKPIDLLQYLCRLITPPGGVILDPFAGSGSTGVAAHNEGFNYILIEIEKEYADIARIRNAQVRL